MTAQDRIRVQIPILLPFSAIGGAIWVIPVVILLTKVYAPALDSTSRLVVFLESLQLMTLRFQSFRI